MANASVELRIAGFGPRMMGGYRHEPGILPVACNLIEKQLPVGVKLANIALGFADLPPHEALPELVSKSNADYIVFESVPIDAPPFDGPSTSGILHSNFRACFDQLAAFWDLLTGEFLSLIEYFGGGDPLAPMLDYLAAVMLVANACKSVGIGAVVLLPVARSLRHSTRRVIAFRSALQDLAKVQGILLVDCVDTLAALPEPSLVQYDRGYLSPTAQEAVGRFIADSIVTDVLSRSRPFEPFDLADHHGQKKSTGPPGAILSASISIARHLNWREGNAVFRCTKELSFEKRDDAEQKGQR